MTRRPFSRLAFGALPEAPRLPHGLELSAARDIDLESRPFGRHRVHLRELGEGPPLLLVHGLMTSSYSWRYVVEPLSRRFRVIAPDLPGAGRSDAPEASYAPGALSTWIGELVDALGIRGCAAVGNSMGGYLCMRLALADPGVFGRLVNIHSPGFPDPKLRALSVALASPQARRALTWLVRRDPERWAHRNVHYFDETLKSREEARAYGAPLATAAGARAFVHYLHETLVPAEMERFVTELTGRRDAGEGFPTPLLLVYARKDPMVPPSVGERLAALLPDARLVWLEDSSHFAQVDSPARLLEAIRPFLDAQPGSPLELDVPQGLSPSV